jgi:hypothetical protein
MDATTDTVKMLPVELLSVDGIFKISTFLIHTPQFKSDILLIFPDAYWPPEVPPPFLPVSIATLLSRICDLTYETIEKLWGLLKDIVWNWTWKAQEIKERYRLYGNDLGYRLTKIRLQEQGHCPFTKVVTIQK